MSIEEGDLIVVWKDGGDALLTKARSSSFISAAGDEVVFAEGVSGYYLTSHVRHVKVHGDVAQELACQTEKGVRG